MVITREGIDALRAASEHYEVAAEALRGAEAACTPDIRWVATYHREAAEQSARNVRRLIEGLTEPTPRDAEHGYRVGEDAEGNTRIEEVPA